MGGAETTNIRLQFVVVAGYVFSFREMVAINMEHFAELVAKLQEYGLSVHEDLKAIVILINVEWVVQQAWGVDIMDAHYRIEEKHRYNHVHDDMSVKAILKFLTMADKARDQQKAMTPGKLADMMVHGITRLQELVQPLTEQQYYMDTLEESANVSTTMNSEETQEMRGRCKKKDSRT